MQPEGGGFWRSTGVVLTMALLALFAWALPGRWQDVMDLVQPPPMPTVLPADTTARAKIAAQLAASPSPAAEAVSTLWRLTGDPNDFLRGQALEALARGHEGPKADPRRVERLKEIAQDDTDWNRRSACVLLIQFDAIKALPFVEPLYMKTTNPNTKAALLAALKEQDGAPLRTAMVQAKSRMLDDLVRPR